MTAHLEARNLCLERGGRPILDHVSLAIDRGEMIALLGPNGAGKTSLLRLLLGLAKPARGEVLLDGTPLAGLHRREVARHLAYVPQHHRPAFPFSVQSMVAMGRASLHGRRDDRSQGSIVADAIARMGIAHLAQRPYTTLSGGELQSMLIARALAQGARTLILDEPAASLDPGQRHRLVETLRALAGEGYTILASLHDPDEARRSFPRAIMMQGGRILSDGASETVLTPDLMLEAYGLPLTATPADRRT